MRLHIDGRLIETMSIDEIGATLEQIASELSIRGNAPNVSKSTSATLLWAFDRIEETARVLRNRTTRTAAGEVA
jgi:hypothetical protein